MLNGIAFSYFSKKKKKKKKKRIAFSLKKCRVVDKKRSVELYV